MKTLTRTYRILSFIFFYLIKLFQANLHIAFDIITPKTSSKPGFIQVPIRLKSRFGVLLFSNLVSMTPGTLSIDYSEEEQELRVHYLYTKSTTLEELDQIQDKIIAITS